MEIIKTFVSSFESSWVEWAGSIQIENPLLKELFTKIIFLSPFLFDLGIFLYLLNESTAYGFFLWKLVSPFQKLIKLESFKSHAGLRYSFEKAFKEVTKSLGDNKVVIFIDDLDRCEPKKVVGVLNTINFLTSTETCYFILGLDPTWVKIYIKDEFKSYAEELELPDLKTPKEKKEKFANDYLEKMINLEVKVPDLAKTAEGENETKSLNLFNKYQRNLSRKRTIKILFQHILFLVLLFLTSFSIYQKYSINFTGFNKQKNINFKYHTLTNNLPQTIINTEPNQENSYKDYFTYYVIIGFTIFIFIIWFLNRRLFLKPVQDSKIVKESLMIWRNVVGSLLTPRTIKKFENKIRYLSGFIEIEKNTKDYNQKEIHVMNLIIITFVFNFFGDMIKNHEFISTLCRFAKKPKEIQFPSSTKLKDPYKKILEELIKAFEKSGFDHQLKNLDLDFQKFGDYQKIIG